MNVQRTETAETQPSDKAGRFQRADAAFRNWVTPDGAPGPSGEGGFAAEAGRYHLYISLACPWAHRTLIFRKLKGLEDMIGLSIVNAHLGERGWSFHDGPDVIPDTVNGAEYISELYLKANPDYSGRYTVPVLWDTSRDTIVSNESSEIIRMFNSAFADVGATGPDFYPERLRAEIDALNPEIYDNVNNGVYRAGFARTQTAYEEAATALFGTLDALDARLADKRYLTGDTVTEADWRLFTTLVRFDAVYYGHFKCNVRRIVDYPNLSGYLRELYQWPGIAGTVNMNQIKSHYYGSHESLNPKGIVPIGPALDFEAPHGRDALAAR